MFLLTELAELSIELSKCLGEENKVNNLMEYVILHIHELLKQLRYKLIKIKSNYTRI